MKKARVARLWGVVHGLQRDAWAGMGGGDGGGVGVIDDEDS